MLKDKVVLISGAGPGLGHQVAKAALREGAKVILTARSIERITAEAKELDESGERVLALQLDLDDTNTVATALERALQHFGQIDALIQIAARHVMGRLEETSNEDWEKAYRTNVVGTMDLVRQISPVMTKQGRGSIVLIGSQSSLNQNIPEMAYAACKGALTSVMYHLAEELGPAGIRVNTVIPSWMWGPALKGFYEMQSAQSGQSEEDFKWSIAERLPLREITPDADVAEAVIFFASDRSRMVTGQSLLVNAGEMMR